MKRVCLFVLLTTTIVMLNACSSGNASSSNTVYAQTTYSNASLNGTYSIELSGYIGEPLTIPNPTSPAWNGVGTIQLNGSGAITGGTLNVYTYNGSSASSCVESLSGTYTIQSTALGSATLVLNSSTSGCVQTTTIPLSIAAAGGGSTVMMAETATYVDHGIAIKQ